MSIERKNPETKGTRRVGLLLLNSIWARSSLKAAGYLNEACDG
ncbi:MAG: hypothetical protein V1796_04650 [Pseudomonadota bacterium]